MLTNNNVLVGAYTKSVSEGPPINSVWRTIDQRLVHHRYDANRIKFDFMLMKLNETVDHLPFVELNSQDLSDGTDVTVIGFGSTQARVDLNSSGDGITNFTVYNDHVEEMIATDDDDALTPRIQILQKVEVEIVSHSTCNGHSMYNGFIDRPSMVCAGTEDVARMRVLVTVEGHFLLTDKTIE